MSISDAFMAPVSGQAATAAKLSKRGMSVSKEAAERLGKEGIEQGVKEAVEKAKSAVTIAEGTLTGPERKAIQEIADKYNTSIEVVGSRAAGKGRNINTDFPVRKEPRERTRSDIDVIIDKDLDFETGGTLSGDLKDIGNKSGGGNDLVDVLSRGRPAYDPKIVIGPG